MEVFIYKSILQYGMTMASKTTTQHSFWSFSRRIQVSIPKEITHEEVLAFKCYKEKQILEEYIKSLEV